jgi:hypothetical protein
VFRTPHSLHRLFPFCYVSSFLCLAFFFLALLQFELRALYLLGRHSTT